MIGNYEIVSPKLSGLVLHESLRYEGFERPMKLLWALDSAHRKGITKVVNKKDKKILNLYFCDLYGIIMKKIAIFATDSQGTDDEIVKIQAMLQEMIKVKKLLSS